MNPTNIFQNGQKLTQFVARQPIFDAQQNVFAYELLYRDSAHNAFPVGTSDEQATSRLFFNTLMMLGSDKLTAHHLAFINLLVSSVYLQRWARKAFHGIKHTFVYRSLNYRTICAKFIDWPV